MNEEISDLMTTDQQTKILLIIKSKLDRSYHKEKLLSLESLTELK